MSAPAAVIGQLPVTSRRRAETPHSPAISRFLGGVGVAGALLGCLIVAIVTGVGLGLGGDRSLLLAAALVAAAAAAGLAALAVFRFPTFLLVLFAVRPTLDALKGSVGGIPDPGVLVGLVFLLAGTAWLLAQHVAGTWHAMSRGSWALLSLVAVLTLGVLGSSHPGVSAQSATKLAAGVLMFVVVEQLAHSRPRLLGPLLVAGAVSLLVPATLGLLQYAGGTARVSGGFVHPNALAEYVVTVGLVAFAVTVGCRGLVRWLAAAVGVTAGVLLVATEARGAWLGFVLGVLIIGFVLDRRVLAVAVLGLIAIVAFVPVVTARFADLGQQRQFGRGDPNSFAFRERYWGEILPLTLASPVTGIGLDSVTTERGLQPHSTPVQSLVEGGALGAIALGAVYVFVGADTRRASAKGRTVGLERAVVVAGAACAAAYGLQSLTDNLLTQALQLWFLAVPVGWALARSRPAGHPDAAGLRIAVAEPAPLPA